MPKRKKNVDDAEKINDKMSDQSQAQASDPSPLSEKDSISKSKPNLDVKNDHRFHKVVDGKDKATKVLYFKKDKDTKKLETSSEAEKRLRGDWIGDKQTIHVDPESRAFHEGDPSKCPNCARHIKKNKTGSQSNEPKLSSLPLASREDVEKAWSTNPAGTTPYFEFCYVSEDLVLPLISMATSVNRALVMFENAQWFVKERSELKARILGKAESHECPGALQVKVSLVGDMLKLLRKLDIRGWTPALIGAKDDFKERRVTLKPRIECVYTPQVVKLEVIDTLKEPFGLKDVDFKPNEDTTHVGKHSAEGNETTEKSDK